MILCRIKTHPYVPAQGQQVVLASLFMQFASRVYQLLPRFHSVDWGS